MKVKELIEALKDQDQEAFVFVPDLDSGGWIDDYRLTSGGAQTVRRYTGEIGKIVFVMPNKHGNAFDIEFIKCSQEEGLLVLDGPIDAQYVWSDEQ